MSQIFKAVTAGSLPPSVPTSFVTDVRNNTTTSPGTAIPAANILQVLGRSTTQDSVNGIRTDADPNNGNILYTELTNRLTGSVTSINAATQNLITFALGATAAVYRFKFEVAGRDTGTGDGIGYTMFASARTDGVNATIIATPFIDNDEDASLLTATVNFVASVNNVILQVTGVAGETIAYKAVGTYVVV